MKLKFVGDKRIRTADLCYAKALLYQLSYIPNLGHSRLELETSPLSGVHSNQLS